MAPAETASLEVLGNIYSWYLFATATEELGSRYRGIEGGNSTIRHGDTLQRLKDAVTTLRLVNKNWNGAANVFDPLKEFVAHESGPGQESKDRILRLDVTGLMTAQRASALMGRKFENLVVFRFLVSNGDLAETVPRDLQDIFVAFLQSAPALEEIEWDCGDWDVLVPIRANCADTLRCLTIRVENSYAREFFNEKKAIWWELHSLTLRVGGSGSNALYRLALDDMPFIRFIAFESTEPTSDVGAMLRVCGARLEEFEVDSPVHVSGREWPSTESLRVLKCDFWDAEERLGGSFKDPELEVVHLSGVKKAMRGSLTGRYPLMANIDRVLQLLAGSLRTVRKLIFSDVGHELTGIGEGVGWTAKELVELRKLGEWAAERGIDLVDKNGTAY